MKARTLVITAGAVVALAAPAVADAKSAPGKVPVKHAAEKHAAKPSFKRQGQSRQIYIDIPGPVNPVATLSEPQLEEQYNADLIAHGLDPVTFPDNTAAPTLSSDSSSSVGSSSDNSTTTSDTAIATTFTVAAASDPSTSGSVVSSATDLWDDC
jgi:hypothetical protein